jgi:hypothetical protein
LPDAPLAFIKDCISDGRIRWTYHVTMRLQTRRLTAGMIYEAMDSLEIIESYPQDKYLPSFLLRGAYGEAVFHVQIATDTLGGNIRIVTMYNPDPEDWDKEMRRRRTR